MPKGAIVYVQGAGSLQRRVASAAKILNCKVVSGPAYDVTASPQNATSSLHRFVPLPCCLGGAARVNAPAKIAVASEGIAVTPSQADKVAPVDRLKTASALHIDDGPFWHHVFE